MRSYPSCWNKTLSQLGFRRKPKKKAKNYDHLRRRSLFEQLEAREMLAIDTAGGLDAEEPIFLSTSISAAPRLAANTTSDPEFFLVQPEIDTDELDGVSPQDITEVITVTTTQEATGPKATISFNSNFPVELPTTLQTLGLELRHLGQVLESYEILIDIAEDSFREGFLADRVSYSIKKIDEVDSQVKDDWLNDTGPTLTLDQLASLSESQLKYNDIFVSDAERIRFYNELETHLHQLETDRLTASTEAELDSVTNRESLIQDITLVLADEISTDLNSTNASVVLAAESLRDDLVAISNPYQTAFVGMGVDWELERSTNLNGDEKAVNLIETGSYQFSDSLEFNLGDEQAMVQVIHYGSPLLALASSIAGSPAVLDGTIDASSPTASDGGAASLHVDGTASAEQETLIKFDLGEITSFTNPTTIASAALQLSEIGTNTGDAEVYIWNGLFGDISGSAADWNEGTLTWDHVDSTLDLGNKLSEFTQLSDWSAGVTTEVDVTSQVQRALLYGDTNGDGAFAAAGLDGDIEAFHLAVTNWDAYVTQYGNKANNASDLLARTDGGLGDGVIDSNDIADFFKRHGYSQGDYNLDGTVQDNADNTIDGLDWAIFNANYGLENARFTQGDGNFDGVVGADDFDIWYNRTHEDNLTPAIPEIVFWVRPSDTTTDIEFASQVHATLAGPTLAIEEQPDLALNRFSINSTDLVVDYAVFGETFSDVKVQIYKAGSPDTLLHETAVQSGSLGSHEVSIPVSVLSSITEGDSIYAKLVGTPSTGTQANTANDQLDFEFTTDSTQTVNSLDDAGMDTFISSKYTLRELLQADELLNWYDTINFDNSILSSEGPSQISLGDHGQDGIAERLEINNDITINGLGADLLEIDARNQAQGFHIAAGLAVTLSGIAVTHGYSANHGGGIYNRGDLTLDGVRVADNSAVAHGGGIYSYTGSTLTLQNSTVDSNSSDIGGGISGNFKVGQSLTIDASTISNNTTTGNAGGLSIKGIADPSLKTEALITNSTFSGNVAGGSGGAIRSQTNLELTIINSTIYNNEAGSTVGGLFAHNETETFLHNTIIAGNRRTSGGPYSNDDAQSILAFDTSSSHNFIGIKHSSTGLADGVNGNQLGTSASPLDPNLSDLGYFGGLTQTHIPGAGSLVLNAGDNLIAASLISDQRGNTNERTNDSQVDVGAVEVQRVANASSMMEIIGYTGYLYQNTQETIDVYPNSTDDSLTDIHVDFADTNLTDFTLTSPVPLSLVTIWALDGDDVITIDTTLDSSIDIEIHGGAGDDTITGGSGNDLLFGGQGKDTIYGQAGNDSLFGGSDEDTMYGGQGNDILDSGNAKFYDLQGEPDVGTDHLDGGEDGDSYIIEYSVGERSINDSGTSGGDTLDFSGWFDSTYQQGVNVDLSNTLFNHFAYNNQYVSWALVNTNIENIIGTQHSDHLIGNELDNVLDGGGGAADGHHEPGIDNLEGAAGNDTYVLRNAIGLGNTNITDQAGIDTIDFSQWIGGEGVDVDLGTSAEQYAGTNQYFSWTLIDTEPTIENVIGTDFNDTITGNSKDNILSGGGGNDILSGGLGHDILRGNAGADTIFGGYGHDNLEGGDGNDDLQGGTGNDIYLFQDKATALPDDLLNVINEIDGNDIIDFSAITSAANADMSAGTFSYANVAGTFNGIDSIVGISSLDLDSTTEGNDSTIDYTFGQGQVSIAGNALFTGFADEVRVTFESSTSYYFDAENDILSASPSNSLIEVEYSAGQLILSGNASAADYLQALHTIVYENARSDTDPKARRLLVEVLHSGQVVSSAYAIISPTVSGTLSYDAVEDISNINPVIGGAGGADDVELYIDDDGTSITFFKFALPNNVTTIDKATINLFVAGFYDPSDPDSEYIGPQEFEAYLYHDTSWNELSPPSSSTDLNNPSVATALGEYQATTAQYISIDVTTAVNSTAESFISIALVHKFSSSLVATVASSENEEQAWRPQISITGEFINQAPVAIDDSYYYEYYRDGTARQLVVPATSGVLLYDSDPDGDPVVADLVKGPQHGQVYLNSDGSFVYEPDADFQGEDYFTYRAFDGLSYSDLTRVDLLPALTNSMLINELPTDLNDGFDSTHSDADYVGGFNSNINSAATSHPNSLANLANPYLYSIPAFEPTLLCDGGLNPDETLEEGYMCEIHQLDDLPGHTAKVEFDVSSLLAISNPSNEIISVELELPPVTNDGWSAINVLHNLALSHHALANGYSNSIIGGWYKEWWLRERARKQGISYKIKEYNAGPEVGSHTNPLSAEEVWRNFSRQPVVFDVTNFVTNKLIEGFGSSPAEISFNIYGQTNLSLGFLSNSGRLIVELAENIDLPQTPTEPGGANEAPYFISPHKTEATAGQLFDYTLIASDPENDALDYGISQESIIWPEGFVPDNSDLPVVTPSADGSRAIMTWTPPIELIGQTVEFREQVRDSAGHLVGRTFEVFVKQDQENQPPIIIADPARNYVLPEATPTVSDNGDNVTPEFIDVILAEGQTKQEQLSVDISDNTFRSEIVFLVDRTGSMQFGFDWLDTVVPVLDQKLLQKGFDERVYGLASFSSGATMHRIGSGGSYWGTASDLVSYDISPSSELYAEKGYHALADVLGISAGGNSVYDFNSVGPPQLTSSQIVLISDENLDGFLDFTQTLEENLADKEALRQNIIASLQGNISDTSDDIILTSIVSARYDGTTSFDKPVGFDEIAGEWAQSETAYNATTILPSDWAISVAYPHFKNFYYNWMGNKKLNASFQIDNDQQDDGNAYIVFDYHDQNDFKFVAAYAKENEWRIGEVSGGQIEYQSIPTSEGVHPEQNYEVSISLLDYSSNSDTIELYVNGRLLASHEFEDEDTLYEGRVGLGTFGSSASFFEISIDQDLNPFDNVTWSELNSFFQNINYTFGKAGSVFPAFGYNADEVAYYAEADGNFSKGLIESNVASINSDWDSFLSDDPYYYSDSFEDYAAFALETGGSVWDQTLLRGITSAPSDPEQIVVVNAFISAFTDAIGVQTLRNTAPIEVSAGVPDLVDIVRDPFAASVENQLGADFVATFTGDGASHYFNLDVDFDGVLQGTVPVRIIAPYVVDFGAEDPDGPPDLTFSWAEGSWSTTDPDHIPQLVNSGREGFVNDRMIWLPPDVAIETDYRFGVTVHDGLNLEAIEEYWWTVTVKPSEQNTAPTIDGVTPSQEGAIFTPPSATVGTGYQIQVIASDSNGDRLRYFLEDDAPGNMTIDPNTGVIQWVPTNIETVNFTVRVSDGRIDGTNPSGLGEDSYTFSVDVLEKTFTNIAPNLDPIPSGYIYAGEPLQYAVNATDINGDVLTYSVQGEPDWIRINSETGVITGAPDFTDVGALSTITVKVDDGQGKSDSEIFQILVLSSNHHPEFRSAPQDAGLDLEFAYRLEAYDQDGDEIKFHLDKAPTGMVVEERADGWYVIWSRDNMVAGNHEIVIVADDQIGGKAYQEFELEVKDASPPVFDGEIFTATPENAAYQSTFNLTSGSEILAEDVVLDNASIARGLQLDTSGVDFINALQSDGSYRYSGFIINWTPTYTGDFPIEITATNSSEVSNAINFTLKVLPEVLPQFNEGPEINTPVLGPFAVGKIFDFTLDITDPNGHQITEVVAVTGTNAPGFTQANLDFDGDVGRIHWTPTASGDFIIVLQATDELGAPSEPITYNIHVAPNAQPKLNAGPANPVFAGQRYTYEFSVSDPNPEDTLRVTLNEEAETAGIFLEESAAEIGKWTLVWSNPAPIDSIIRARIEVSDGRSYTAANFDFRVFDPTSPEAPINPTGSGPIEIPVGREFKYSLFSSGQPVLPKFTVARQDGSAAPAGISISSDGTLTWTPTYADSGGLASDYLDYDLKVMVDREDPLTDVEIPIALRVVKPEDFSATPPSINSSASLNAVADRLYNYEPSIENDTGVGQVRWIVDKGPDGFEYNPSSNQFTWLPSSDDIGKQFEIILRAEDALNQSVVEQFTLDVNGAGAIPVVTTAFPRAWVSGQAFSFTVTAVHSNNHELIFDLLDPQGNPLPGDLSIGTNDGIISWTNPTSGEYEFIIRVSDRFDPLSVYDWPVELSVVAPGIDIDPIIQNIPHNRFASVGSEFRHNLSIWDPELIVNTWELVSMTEIESGTVESINPVAINNSGLLTWTPIVEQQEKSYSITLRASDVTTTGEETYVTFDLHVVENAAPIISSPVLSPTVGTILTYNVVARDPDGDKLTYAIENPTTNITIDPQTGQIHWEVPTTVPGTAPTFDLVVTDEHDLSVVETGITIDVQPDNTAPTISLYIEDGQGNIVKPGDTLDSSLSDQYKIWFSIEDNLGHDSGDVNWILEVVDTASLNVPGNESAKLFSDRGGLISTNFTGGANSLNSGLLFITLTAGDADGVALDESSSHDDVQGNKVTRTFRYNVSDSTQERYAQLLNVDRTDEILVVDERFTVRGIAHYDTGGGTYAGYDLMLVSVDDPEDSIYLTRNADAEFNMDSVIGVIDPTLIKSGQYRLYLEVRSTTDENCQCIAGIDEQIIEIRNDSRLGNLDLSFTDISVDIGGIPISLVRNYSSALVGKGTVSLDGDFGPGWTLNFLQSGIEVGHHDQVTSYLNEPIADRTRLLVELPDGSIHRFEFDIISTGTSESGPFRPIFRPDPDVSSTLKLANQDQSLLLLYNQNRGDNTFVTANTNQDFILSNFGSALVLTSQGGLKYLFDINTGKLTSIEDENGRSVSISHDESTSTTIIVSENTSESASHQIVIHYDSQGRIDWIEDPLIETPTDKRIEYYYGDYSPDGSSIDPGLGNLGKVVRRNGEYVVYGYSNTEYQRHLTEIYDSAGIKVLEADYYDSSDTSADPDQYGRLEQLIDASGQDAELGFTIDLGDGRMVTRVDDGNNKVDEVTNNRGNVLRRVQLVNEHGAGEGDDEFLVTAFEYNNRNLLTHQSVPYIVTGAQNRYGDPLNDPISEKDDPNYDQERWAQIITYDEKDRTKTSSDALGNTTTFVYDDNDRVIETIDPNGYITFNVYDPYTSNLLETYVAEDKISQKFNHSRFVYDNYGRITKTYQVDGSEELLVSETSYNSEGRVQWTKDAAGLKRFFGYDLNGNQTHSWSNWTDGEVTPTLYTLVSKTIYDADGRVTNTEEHELTGNYDETQFETLKTTLSSTSLLWTTSTNYDTQGRVDLSIDRYGAETRTVYDIRGNVIESRTQAKDESNNNGWLVTRTLYDDQGRVIFSADPYFSLGTGTPASASPNNLYGTYTVYDDQGRVVSTQRHSGVDLDLVLNGATVNVTTDYTITTTYNFNTETPDSLDQTFFDDIGRVLYTLSETGARTDYYYDATGRQIATLGPEVDINGTPQRLLRLSTFDAGGRLTQSATNIGITETIATEAHPDLNDLMNPEWVKRNDSAQQTTFYEYDAAGRQTAVITTEIDDPNNSGIRTHLRTETIYDGFGRRTDTITGLTQIDPFNPATIDDTYKRVTSYEYDTAGNLTAVNLPQINHPDTDNPVLPRYEYTFDQYGNRTSIRDNIVFDVTNEVVSYDHDDVTNDDTRETVFTFDHRGRQLTRTLPGGQTESMHYNDRSREDIIGSETDPVVVKDLLNGSVGYGQLEYSISFEDKVTAYRYDNTAEGAGRLVAKYYYVSETAYLADRNDDDILNAAAESVTHTYDEFGRQLTSTHSLQGATTQVYDPEGRLIQIESPEGILNYGYNDLGQKIRTWTSKTTAGTDAITDTDYLYDQHGRLKRVVVKERFDTVLSTTETTGYIYDLEGQLDYEELPGGTTRDLIYDELGRPAKVHHFVDLDADGKHDPGERMIASFDYAYDLHNKQTELFEEFDADNDGTHDASHRYSWKYDELGRLVEEIFDDGDDGNSTGDYIDRFSFDLVGNRLQKEKDIDASDATGFVADETTDYTYDRNDRVVTEVFDAAGTTNDINTVYEYGPNATTTYGGDHTTQTAKTVREGTTIGTGTVVETQDMEYNLQGRLSKVTTIKDGSTSVSEYEYNDQGFRVNQTLDGVKTVYVVDPNNHTGYAQTLEEQDASGNVVKTFTLGLDVVTQAAVAAVYHLLYDLHGSTRAVVEGTTTNAVQFYTYDAYGKLLNLSGFTSALQSAFVSLLYSGEFRDGNTGWDFNRARWSRDGIFNRLDDFAGNFEDPQSLHKYLYAHGDPVNGIDPSGESYIGLLLSSSLRAILFGITVQGIYDAVNRVNLHGWSGLRWDDALTLLPGAGYFGSAIKYARSINNFTKKAKGFHTIAKKLHTAGGEIANLVGRARSSLAGQLGTQVHQAFKASRFGRMFRYLQSFTSPASQWFRVSIDQPLSSFGFPGTGDGSRPDFTLIFPKFKFAISIDVKPVPQAVYKKGFLRAQDYLYAQGGKIRSTRLGTKKIFNGQGYNTLYFYLPYPSFVK